MEPTTKLWFVQSIRKSPTVMDQEKDLKGLVASAIAAPTVSCGNCADGLFSLTNNNRKPSLENKSTLQFGRIKPQYLRTKCAKRFISPDAHLLTIICDTNTQNNALRGRLYLESISLCRTKNLADKLLEELQKAAANV